MSLLEWHRWSAAIRVVVATTVVATALLVATSAAWAAPPPNDQRTAPQQLVLPATVAGTTQSSTLESDEPGSCQALKGSVWFAIRPGQDERVAVRLAAGGDLDAVVDVFRRVRSQLESVDCDVGDSHGRAELRFQAEGGADYLIRVGQRANSVAGDFRLDVFAPQPPPKPPGRHLPARGVRGTVDALQDTTDAYSLRMRPGRSYRINLAQPEGGCVSLALYPPGTGDFESQSPVRQRGCGGYMVFTPAAGQGGRYSLLAQAAPRRRGGQPYHLQAAPTGGDDLAPGRRLDNYQRAHGVLHGNRVDAVDLYRFSLARRSDVRLSLGDAPFRLLLLGDRGQRIAGSVGFPLELRMAPGRYYVAVIAHRMQRGRYVLRRAARTITATSVRIDGRRSVIAAPGRTVVVGVRLTPGVAGPVLVTLERFDPLAGWQFFRQVELRAAAGSAAYAFRPPAEGRWRASAQFVGTRVSAPSASGLAHVLVASPLALASATGDPLLLRLP